MTNSRGVNNVVLSMHGGNHHGLTVENGVYISRITPGSIAAREGSIAVGDRLLSVSFYSYSIYLIISYFDITLMSQSVCQKRNKIKSKLF